jgi:L-lactate dehydrogenase complex protein LldE
MSNTKPAVTLFIPCLVDQVYPEMGLAMDKILKKFGYQTEYFPEQTCCGQPAFNAGYHDEARKVAANFIHVFKNAQIIVAPSGSCTVMVRKYYPELFKGTELQKDAIQLSKNVLEFSEFLDRDNLIEQISGSFSGTVGFHNSCHSYREAGIEQSPQKIMNRISDMIYIKQKGEPVCCGFGGLFSFKFDTISAAMAKSRLQSFLDLDVQTLVVNDPGCIMHMRQEAIDRRMNIKILHLTEFLVQAMDL